MNKKLAFISAMLICIALLRSTDFAVNNYNITVNGIQVSDDNASDVLGDGSVSYDKSNNTLILNNANLLSIESTMDSTLTVELNGVNSVKPNSDIDAVKTNAGLILKGNGWLSISCKDDRNGMRCINAKGDVIVDRVKLEMNESNGAGIYTSSGKNITLQNGAVVTGNAGCLLTTNFGMGGGKITINNSIVKAPNGNGEVTGFCCIWAYNLDIIESEIVIEAPSAIYADNQAMIDRSDIDVKSTSAPASGDVGNPGIYSGGLLILNDSNIKSESVRHNAIYSGDMLTILGGNILANTGHTSASAINAQGIIEVEGPVTIETLSSAGKAFSSKKEVIIKTSFVNTGKHYKVFAGDDEKAEQLSDSPFKWGTDITEKIGTSTYLRIEEENHKYDELIIKEETIKVHPTCLQAGVYYKSCACGEISKNEEETIAALGHDLIKTGKVEATCTKAGKEEYYTCQREDCGKHYADEIAETEITNIDTYGVIAATNHEHMEEIPSNAATCTTAGNNKYYYCQDCDNYFKDEAGQEETNFEEETIAALGHDLVKTDKVEVSCTKAGKEEYYTCQRAGCGKHFVDEKAETEITDINAYGIIAAKGHEHMEEISSNAVTCTTAGNNKYYHCHDCDNYFKDEAGQEETSVEEETIAALGHDFKKTERIEATCTEAGKEEYFTCQRVGCGKHYADESAKTEVSDINAYGIIAATNHEHMEEILSNAATCTTAGNNKYYHCPDCDNYFKDEAGQEETSVEEEIIAALGHDLIKTERVEATCTEAGKEEYFTCKRGCGKYYADENEETEIIDINAYGIIAAKGHEHMEEISSKSATCTTAGNNRYYHCEDCDKCFKDEEGREETSIEKETIPALGHDLIKTERVEATCTEEGKEEYFTCKRGCGKHFADEKAETEITDINTYGIIAAKSHSHMEEISSKTATCTTAGNNKYYHCPDCEKYFKDDEGREETSIEKETIAALGHDLLKTERVEATYTEAGKEEYYTCKRGCGKYYADEKGETEIKDIKMYGIIRKLVQSSNDNNTTQKTDPVNSNQNKGEKKSSDR